MYLHKTVGCLYIEERLPNTKGSKSARWKCRCECGKYKILRSNQLKPFEAKGCICYGTRLKDLTGQTFGDLTVLYRTQNSRSNATKYQCQCSCGKEVDAYATHLVSGNTKSCGCKRIKSGSEHHQWNGVGEISGDWWSSKVLRTLRDKRVRIEINIDKEYAWQLFLDQDRKCALSGILLEFPLTNNHIGTASLDRIDSSKGYIEGNVQWVHKDINMMKRVYDQDYFIRLCKLVAENN